MAGFGDKKSPHIKRYKGDGVHVHTSSKKRKLSHTKEKRKTKEEDKFPSTLEGFNYQFNKDGQLRHIETGQPFVFVVRQDDQSYNQRRYEALGEVITEHVYGLLETEAGLKRIYIPVDATASEAKSFVFASKREFDEADNVLLLIHGDGVVRAGQWARKLIINDCLDSGSQLPYIRRAKQMGFEVLVLNSNLNQAIGKNGTETSVRESSSSEAHALCVWNHFLADSPVKSVAVVAHSYGGVCVLNLAVKNEESFQKKVFFVALTDSIHQMRFRGIPSSIRRWYSQNAINWVISDEPLDTVISRSRKDCLEISAGTKKHEETSWKSIDSIFSTLEERLVKKSKQISSERGEL